VNPIEQIALACGGAKKTLRGFVCRCPAHEDSTPSLSIDYSAGGKVLVHCFAGCDQNAVVEALRCLGVWNDLHHPEARKHVLAGEQVSKHNDNSGRLASAARVWKMSCAAEGTLAEIYLQRRGLTLPIPSSVRFHHGLRHPDGLRWPAMVALVTDAIDSAPTAIHRTFLSRDGTSKAPVGPAKMMLGPCGGGVVRLGGAGRVLLIGEGIETSLSVLQATGCRTWAALSSSGLRRLALSDDEIDVVILADADAAGEAAAMAAARRWAREGRRVRVARPPAGLDFNDMLIARRPSSAWAGSDAGRPSVPGSTSRVSSHESDRPCR